MRHCHLKWVHSNVGIIINAEVVTVMVVHALSCYYVHTQKPQLNQIGRLVGRSRIKLQWGPLNWNGVTELTLDALFLSYCILFFLCVIFSNNFRF